MCGGRKCETDFTFKNKHSNDFGVTVQTQSRPIKPEMKIQTYDSPYIDGEYEFFNGKCVQP